MTRVPQTLDEIDFWDLDMFEFGDPHAAYRILRAEAPVWWHDRPAGEPFWAITTQADARPIFARHRPFERALFLVRTGRPLVQTQIRGLLKCYGRGCFLKKPVTPHAIRHAEE